MIAIREAYRAGLLSRPHWLPNLISGIIVGVVALPLAMAFAIASGAKPEQGIYTSIIAGLCVSLFGGSRLQIAGPTGAFIVVLAGITAKHGIEGLQLATLMAGILLMLLGLFKLGRIIRHIPESVITGFTAGIGVIIWFSQWPDFFGIAPIKAEHFHEKLLGLMSELPGLHLPTTILALSCLFILLLWPKTIFAKRVPGPLVAMLAATAIQSIFHFQGIATIGSAFGGIPQGLPSLTLPDFGLGHIMSLIGPAFTIAMLGAIESLLSAVVADGMAATSHHSNQELIGQGLANIVAPLFGGFAATGAIARTATNVRNGGTGPLAGVVHSLFLIFIILFLAPLAANIPLASLAAILFVVAWNMSDAPKALRMAMAFPGQRATCLIVTFLLTVFVDLTVAVIAGVALSLTWNAVDNARK